MRIVFIDSDGIKMPQELLDGLKNIDFYSTPETISLEINLNFTPPLIVVKSRTVQVSLVYGHLIGRENKEYLRHKLGALLKF